MTVDPYGPRRAAAHHHRASLRGLLVALAIALAILAGGLVYTSGRSRRLAVPSTATPTPKHAKLGQLIAKTTLVTRTQNAEVPVRTVQAPTSGLAACTTSEPADPRPNGPSGTWGLVFDDEFNGTSINTSTWNTDNGYTNQNNATDSSANIQELDGCAILRLASARSGAQIATKSAGLQVGEYAEARIQFAGRGTTVDNWPAFWTAGPGWPASGEQDVFEGEGEATVNYHFAVNGNDTEAGPFQIAGDWAGTFHTYGVYRGPTYCEVYWDGRVVSTYPTEDNGGVENLVLTEGAANTLAFGVSGEMLVDYVRIWRRS